MKKICLLLAQLIAVYTLCAQQPIPVDLARVIESSGNKKELLATLHHYQQKKQDSLKFKAACFLISNIDLHHSDTYYWADSTGNKIAFNELDYPDFAAAIKAFDIIKSKAGKLRPVSMRYPDIDSIKSVFLIDNIDQAFQAWQSPFAKNISFEDFCEYLLPYRISIEPLQNWRSVYKEKFNGIKDSAANDLERTMEYLKADINTWFTCTYKLEKRNEPLPRLGALQLLQRKKGACEDVADMTTFALRSMGIPASVDVVPFWATSTGSHMLNVAFKNNKAIPYDILLLYDSIKNFIREPAKVLRITYSKQKNTLPYFSAKENIPPGFLREVNYIDVTDQYWPVKDITCKLFPSVSASTIVYACVLNGLKWQPAWWGFVRNDSVAFKNMCKGAVFLPTIYINGKIQPAGYPVASGYEQVITLQPSKQTHTVHIKEQEHYLLYRPGKKYKLYYWEKDWVLLGEQKTDEHTDELLFNNVPQNALLLLVPEYSQKKERPFIVTNEGKRLWW